jgi:hypothetical protein
MVRIQLENGYLDVKDNTAFPLNFQVGDIRDVSTRKGAFSKTIVLEDTKNNHDLLNHYYDVNIEAGTFDINTITKCSVIQNGIPVMEDASLQLISVKKTQTNDAYEQSVTYEVLVKDSQSDFFTELGATELTDLDFSDLNHTYDSSTIVASWANTVADGYKYLLPYSGDNFYPLKEMKPAIYAKTYFDRIFSNAGFSYDWSTLNASYFDKLLIPYNGELEAIDYSAYNVEANQVVTIDGLQTTVGQNVSFSEPLISWTETLDAFNLFTPLTGIYTNTFTVNSGEAINFNFSCAYDIDLINSTGANAFLNGFGTVNFGAGYRYLIRLFIYVNGVLTSSTSSGTFGQFDNDFFEGNTLANGTTNLGSFNRTFNIAVSNLQPSDTIQVYAGIAVIEYLGIGGNGYLRWQNVGGNNVLIDVSLTNLDIEMTIEPSTNITGSGGTLQVNNYIPKKIKQSDFVKSIFTMYNLYTEIDPDNPNKLILSHRDDYYDAGQEKDWTYKLAKDREQDLKFLPEITSKRLILTYKDDKDSPNTTYFNATNEIYGQVEYIFENEYVKNVDKKEILFSPTPMGKTVFDAVVPLIAGAAPKTNIRILFDGGLFPCNPFNIYDYGTTGQTNLVQYPSIIHFDNPDVPTFDLNFGVCDYYFYQQNVLTNNNLFNLYWRRTIGQIDTGKMLTAEFDLRETDIATLKLNDKIRIDNSWWNINKIIDYDCNNPKLTKVELLSVDTEIDYARFTTGKPIFPTPSEVGNITTPIINSNYENTNVISLGSNALVFGQGNVIQSGFQGVVIGNNKSVSSGDSGIWTDNINGKSLSNFNPYGIFFNPTFIDQDYTVLVDDTMIISNGAALVDVTLPPVGNLGKTYVIKNISTFNVDVYGDSGETIDGNVSYPLSQWFSLILVDSGTEWLNINY